MALISWTEDLKLNIPSIDTQHKRLVDMVNDFYKLIQNEPSDKLIDHMIKKMKAYTLEHFETEEKYFEIYNYPETEEHKQEHQLFIEKVNDLENRYYSGQLILTFEITNFLKNWLHNHIKGIDSRYAEHLIYYGAE